MTVTSSPVLDYLFPDSPLLWWDREGAQGIAVMRFSVHLLKQVCTPAGLYSFALEIISCRILQFADIVKGYHGINNG